VPRRSPHKAFRATITIDILEFPAGKSGTSPG